MRALRWRDLKHKVGLSRTTVWRLEQAGRFPRRRHLSRGVVAWLSDEIDEWLRDGPSVQKDAADRTSRRGRLCVEGGSA